MAKATQALYERIIALDLKRDPRFDELGPSLFAEIYNGYGPDCFPSAARAALTWVYRNFRELAGVHDVDYYFSDRTRAGWLVTQERWRLNIDILLDDVYPRSRWWARLTRAYARRKLMLAYRVLWAASYPLYVGAGGKRA